MRLRLRGLSGARPSRAARSDETLPRFRETDEKIKHRDKEGRPVTYAELLEKADPKMAEMVKPAELAARQNKARDATARLSRILNGGALDALIVMSDDQDEAYLEDARPTFAIYYGDTILNSNEQHEQYHRRFPEWYVKNRKDLTLAQGYEAARYAVLMTLAAVKYALGDLDRVQQFVHLLGFVNSAPGFGDQPRVINGAADLSAETPGT